MTERERLIGLLKKGQAEHSERLLAEIRKLLYEKHRYNSATDKVGNLWDELADYLLANGVVVPACKVGDTVYFPMETDGECEPYVDVGTVFAIAIDERHTLWISVRYESGLKYYHTSDDFGKTVFLACEEAENCCCEILDDAALEKEKAEIKKEMADLQNRLNALNKLTDHPTKKESAIKLGYSSHDCETHYKCPCCGKAFGSWTVFHQEKNENGTNKYCPHCKEELNGLS